MKITVRQPKKLIKEQVKTSEEGESILTDADTGLDMKKEWSWEIYRLPGNRGYKVIMKDEFGGGETFITTKFRMALKIIDSGPTNEPGEWLV